MRSFLIHFARYGPYHHARLTAAHEVLSPLGWEVVGLEVAGGDATYAWDQKRTSEGGPRIVTVFPNRVFEDISSKEYRDHLFPMLDSLQPDAMAIAGWGSTDAVTCLSWCRKHDIPRFVMSETRVADGKRVLWKELVKGYLISRFDGGLVGGHSHRDYLAKLGMKQERIKLGYNVVDNEYFRQDSEIWRMKDRAVSPFFLASNRFIERKNLLRLVEAYASYVESTSINGLTSSREGVRPGGPSLPWNLCLLGDGEQRSLLIARCNELGLQVIETAPWEPLLNVENLKRETHCNHGVVWLPGFRQIEELPRFYAHAGCFVHPAFEEPWGLVINEAMACGMPILSGDNVGAAEELVVDGENGWKFDARDVAEMSDALERMAKLSTKELKQMGEMSRRILEDKCPTEKFGLGLKELIGMAP